MREITTLLLFVASIESYSQQFGSKEFIFEWTPNPTQFIRENHNDYLSNDEYDSLLSCAALFFEAHVDLFNSEITKIRYSSLSSDYNKTSHSIDLSENLARKVEKILLNHIGLTKVKHLYNEQVPKETRIFYISLDFDKRDRALRKRTPN